MNLHELMGTAVNDLPELPDLLPEVERIHRRRANTKRATMVAASTALVLGVGTLTIASPWAHPNPVRIGVGANDSGGPADVTQPQPSGSGRTTPKVSASTLSRFETEAVSTLQSLWPYPDQKVSWDPNPDDGPWPDLNYQIETPYGKIGIWVYYYATFGSPAPNAPTGNALYAVVSTANNGESVQIESWQGPNCFLAFQVDGPFDKVKMSKEQWNTFGSSPKLLTLYRNAKQLDLEPS